MQYLKYGKDNYWTGDKMADQATQIAAKIFPYAFPGCQALFEFDNASNHSCFAHNALVASRMNLNPGGKQPLMCETFAHCLNRPQSMVVPRTDVGKMHIWDKPKGAKWVLQERKLWPKPHGLLLQCPTTNKRTGCSDREEGCCAVRVLSQQRDFKEQKGCLEEELRALHHEVIFYPKFHCELNFIER
jgi:hypothetical protein